MSGFMCKIFQFDLKILLIGGRVGLNVVTNGMRVLVWVVLYDNVSWRGNFVAFSICFSTRFLS